MKNTYKFKKLIKESVQEKPVKKNKSLKEDWSRGIIFSWKISTQDVFNAFKQGKIDRLGNLRYSSERFFNKKDYQSFEKYFSQFVGHSSLYFDMSGLPAYSGSWYLSIYDRNQSTLWYTHLDGYDDPFTYKMYGGTKAFRKAKKTNIMQEIQDKTTQVLQAAGIQVYESKVQVMPENAQKLDLFATGDWTDKNGYRYRPHEPRQAQWYNESLNEDYDSDSDFIQDIQDVIDNLQSLISDIRTDSVTTNSVADLSYDIWNLKNIEDKLQKYYI